MAGRLQAVYVKTEKGVLFEIKPYVHIPRSFKRFCGLMCKYRRSTTIFPSSVVYVGLINLICENICIPFVIAAAQLLQKLSITAVGKGEKLLNVIKNPVTRHLPVNSKKIGDNLHLCFFFESNFMIIACLIFEAFSFVGLSYSSDWSVNLCNYVAAANDDSALVFMVYLKC